MINKLTCYQPLLATHVRACSCTRVHILAHIKKSPSPSFIVWEHCRPAWSAPKGALQREDGMKLNADAVLDLDSHSVGDQHTQLS